MGKILPTAFYIFACYCSTALLHHRRSLNPVIDIAANAKGDDAECAESQRQLRVDVRTEGWQRIRIMLDEHSLDDEQIVVQAHHRVDQGDEDYCIDGSTDGRSDQNSASVMRKARRGLVL